MTKKPASRRRFCETLLEALLWARMLGMSVWKTYELWPGVVEGDVMRCRHRAGYTVCESKPTSRKHSVYTQIFYGGALVLKPNPDLSDAALLAMCRRYTHPILDGAPYTVHPFDKRIAAYAKKKAKEAEKKAKEAEKKKARDAETQRVFESALF